jgi:hypothetical protein
MSASTGRSIGPFTSAKQLLRDIHHPQRGPAIVYENNEGPIKLANNPTASHTTTHVDIRHHYTRELVESRTIAVISIPMPDMLVGGLSVGLPQPKHTMLFK